VCVITVRLAQSLFGNSNPLGRTLRHDENAFTVVGLVDVPQPKQVTALTMNDIFVPITTMQARYGDQLIIRDKGTFRVEIYQLSEIWIRPATQVDLRAVSRVVAAQLATTHPDGDVMLRIPTIQPR